jgi:hypothetical protein
VEWDSSGVAIRVNGSVVISSATLFTLPVNTDIGFGAYPAFDGRDLQSKIDAVAMLNDPHGVVCLGSATASPTPSPTPVATPVPGSVCSSYGSSLVAFYGGNSDGQLRDSSGHGLDLIATGTVPNGGSGQPEGDHWLGSFFSGTGTQAWLNVPPAAWPGTTGAFEMKIKFVAGNPNTIIKIERGADFLAFNFNATNYGFDLMQGGTLVAAPYNPPPFVDGQLYTLRLEWGAFGVRAKVDGTVITSSAQTLGWASVDNIIVGAYPGFALRDLQSPIDALAVLSDPNGDSCMDYGSASPTRTPSPTYSATPTPSPSPTLPTNTPTPSPVPTTLVLNRIIADFDSGDFTNSNGGPEGVSIGGSGELLPGMEIDLVTGSSFSASSFSAHCSAMLPQDLTGGVNPSELVLYCTITSGPGQVDLSTVAPEHAISFSFKGDTIGDQVMVSVFSPYGEYSYPFTVVDTAWHEMTVYFPDVSDPSLVPRLGYLWGDPWAHVATTAEYIDFGVKGNAAGSHIGGFSVDDVRFGEAQSQSSPVQVAAALGATVAQVNQAYNYQLDEQLTWIVLRLAAHCGCSVQQIITMRETRSWGQVAADVGTTWAAVLAEVAGAGLAPPLVDATRMERSLLNGPLPTPAPHPQIYVPVSAYVLPTPTGSCP